MNPQNNQAIITAHLFFSIYKFENTEKDRNFNARQFLE